MKDDGIRIFIADCVGRGGFVAGVIGVLLWFFGDIKLGGYLFSVLPESVTLWMLIILILISTVIMTLSKISEVLIAQYNKDDTQELRHIHSELERLNRKDDTPEFKGIREVLIAIHNEIDSPKFDRILKELEKLNRYESEKLNSRVYGKK